MIYFVTENYLKKQTAITQNVDITNVSPWIRPMCETRIRPILGKYFYTYLLAKYNAQTLSEKEEELVTYIQSCIAWRSAAKAVFSVSRPIKNIGMQKLNAENSDAVDLTELSFGMDTYDQIASGYQRDLIDYLIENRADFTEFMDIQNKDAKARTSITGEDIDDGYTDSFMVI